VRCFLGLTATATKETVVTISKHLNLDCVESDCIRGTILPPNLNLSVSRDCHKEQVLAVMINAVMLYTESVLIKSFPLFICCTFHT